MQPNRMGLGMRPPMPSFGQGPTMGALAQMGQFGPPQTQKQTTLFVGSISGGILDEFMNRLLSACGPLKSFKRLITPANKPQGFGFAEFEDPDSALRAISLLHNVELPALEDGCANKKLLIKPDEKTRAFLDAYSSQRKSNEGEEAKMNEAKAKIEELVQEINQKSQEYAENGLIDKEKYVIPPHLHDLQEADLPETQRGLVISEIAQFRERAAKREREKMRDVQQTTATILANAPSGPKMREWGKGSSGSPGSRQGFGKGPQGYSKPVPFVKAGGETPEEDERRSRSSSRVNKTDEELEQERKEARRRDEENSYKDRERRYEPRERARIQALERAIARERQTRENEERDRVEMRSRLDIWDDDESDELFYVDRARWRHLRSRRLEAEEAADGKSRRFEEQETENLRRESEVFLAKQMDELQALADEQRKAGMLLDDGAPVRLQVSLSAPPPKESSTAPKEKAKAVVFNHDEEEEEAVKARKIQLVKLDFSVAESSEKIQERLEKIRDSVPQDKDTLFAAKVRWDGMNDSMIDKKMEPLIKRLMMKYLGEEEEDLIMFVVEHLKDHKGPQKLVEGLEPVLDEDATHLTVSVWRQVIFESMAYADGLLTEKMLVE